MLGTQEKDGPCSPQGDSGQAERDESCVLSPYDGMSADGDTNGAQPGTRGGARTSGAREGTTGGLIPRALQDTDTETSGET